MFMSPNMASTINHIKVIGPNKLPTAAVPKRWITKSATRIMTEIGNTASANVGVAIAIPSTAERTEIAGVMTDSPSSMQAPNMPITIIRKYCRLSLLIERSAKAINESTPPSPLLSARITTNTYLSVTTIKSAQIIMEITPKSASRL